MRESTLRFRAGSHLLGNDFTKGEEEIYLGRGMPNPELYNMLKRMIQIKKADV